MTRIRTTVRWVIKIVVAVTGVALAAGTTYQGVTTALERRDFPAPGARISVGDHQLHLTCIGDGLPTVVLEAPEGGNSAAWGHVQPRLAARTRVCAYDRSGLGWSEASGLAFDPRRVTEELHTLLGTAKVATPVVMAGQSLGAAYVRLYAARYQADVSTAVLIDEPAAETGDDQVAGLRRTMQWAPWLARTGVLRLTRQLASSVDGLPGTSGGAMRAFLFRPDHLTRASREIDAWSTTVALASEAALPSSIRVERVFTAGHVPGRFLTSPSDAAAVVTAIAATLDPRAAE